MSLLLLYKVPSCGIFSVTAFRLLGRHKHLRAVIHLNSTLSPVTDSLASRWVTVLKCIACFQTVVYHLRNPHTIGAPVLFPVTWMLAGRSKDGLRLTVTYRIVSYCTMSTSRTFSRLSLTLRVTALVSVFESLALRGKGPRIAPVHSRS